MERCTECIVEVAADDDDDSSTSGGDHPIIMCLLYSIAYCPQQNNYLCDMCLCLSVSGI